MFDPMQAAKESHALDAAYLMGGVSAVIREQAKRAIEELSDGADDGDTSPPDDAAVVPG